VEGDALHLRDAGHERLPHPGGAVADPHPGQSAAIVRGVLAGDDVDPVVARGLQGEEGVAHALPADRGEERGVLGQQHGAVRHPPDVAEPELADAAVGRGDQ